MAKTSDKQKEWKDKIDGMSHRQMAECKRFTGGGRLPLPFMDPVLSKYFNDRFKKFGGMTPAMSKLIGWRPKGGSCPSR